MRKKGFTLVELLATIVVLSVIALIAVPIVINVIEKAKKSALVSSVNGLVESANMYYTNEIIKGDINDNVIFDFEEGIQTSENKLSYKGKVYNRKLILTSDSDVITCIDDGKYYAYKEKNSDEVVSGIGTCVYDGTTGDFTIESDIDVIQKECDSDKQELQDRIEELTDNVNSLQITINEKEYEISNLQATIDNLNNEITVLTGEKEELINQLALSNTSNSELQEKINELNGTIATLESSIEAKNNEITVLNGEKKDLQTALDTKTAELATLNENLGKVTATASDVLSGKTILTSSGLVTGSMTNNGSVSQSLNAGGSYTIPKGYHDGTGKVTANTLSSQTSATAVASNLLSGKTAWVNGSKITGSMANKSGATVSATTVTESETNALISIPANGYYDTNSKISVQIETIKNDVSSLSVKLIDEFLNKKVIFISTSTNKISMGGRYFKRTNSNKCLICKVLTGGYYSYYLISKDQSYLSGTNGDLGGISIATKSTSKNTYYCGYMQYAWADNYDLYIDDARYTGGFFDLSKEVDKYMLDLLIDEFLS